ncbi:MAG: alpha/beta hydrolase family protein [Flavobacteriales bacterium]
MITTVINSSRNKSIHIDVNFCKQNKQPIVIFSHGFKGFKDWGPFNAMSAYFADSGLNFLKFNFSHNGVTTSNPCEFTDLDAFGNNNFTIELEDLDSVIHWVLSELKDKVDINRIFLMGHSRGGGISILTAEKNIYIKKLVSWASVSDFERRIQNDKIDLWQERGVVYVFNSRTNQQLPLFYQFYEDFTNNKDYLSIPNASKKLSIPVLIVHAKNDKTVDFSDALELKAWIKNASLFSIEDSDHVFDSKHPFYQNQFPENLQLAIDNTISFFKT